MIQDDLTGYLKYVIKLTNDLILLIIIIYIYL
jgi:hypothetical protein